MKYIHLFFDLDHTLWDFEHNARLSLHQLYEEYQLAQKTGYAFIQFYQSYVLHNQQLWEDYRKQLISREELQWKRMWLALADIQYPDEKLAYELGKAFLELLPHQSQLIPGAKETLDYLSHKPYQMHILTNGFPEIQGLKLQQAGIAHYFAHVITSAEAGCLKPDTQFFRYALQQTKAQAVESIMIGDDWEADICGARQAGMDQVFFNPRQISISEQPTYMIVHLDELKQIL
ncbi:MAG: YjjG family noncanonical pyrimidine nucleotidase [Thermoflavifilum sp.]|nr:YjjG family noncanonical pyrimidine nucleotidase [Thermoflavifilum sp.]